MNLRKYVVAGAYFLVGRVGRVRFERGNGEEEGKYDDAKGPNVNFKMVALPRKNFRGDVVGGTTDSSLAFAFELKFGGQPEISYFNFIM